MHSDSYPRIDRLLDDEGSSVTRERLIEKFGEPENSGAWDGSQWVRFVVGGGYLHFTFDADGNLELVTAMLEAP